MRKSLLLILTMVAMCLPLQNAGAAGEAPPFDYSNVSDLSAPVHQVIREPLDVTMRDGARLYAEVVRPAGPGRFSTILELSPYNGGNSIRTGYLPGDSLAGYFAPRGYAVVLADVRGTGNSEGCLDYMGPVDRVDAYDLVEWLASQSWSDGRVGMVGVSYVGSTPTLAAAMRPPSLKTIVPIAGLARMYDHQFQGGVPYYLQWAGAMGFYDVTAQHPANRQSDRWPRNYASYGCGLPNSAASNHVDVTTGRYTAWHQARDFTTSATSADIPVFMVHGFRDGAARPISMRWWAERNHPGDKAWFGQWGHDASDREEQFTGALHRWFDHHLKQRDVPTGPPVEVFLNGEEFEEIPPPVRTSQRWPGSTAALRLYAWADGTLRTEPASPGEALVPLPYPRNGGMSFFTEPLQADVEVAGFPEMVIEVALPDGRRIDVLGVLYDDGGGQRVKITQGTINPELRLGLGIIEPVRPMEVMRLEPPVQPLDHIVRAGHRIEFRITSRDADKVPLAPGPGAFLLSFGGPDGTGVSLQTVQDPVYHPDPRR